MHDTAIDNSRLVDRLRRFVGVDSCNPGAQENALARMIGRELADDVGAEVTFVETFPGRPSVAAVLDSGAPGPRLVLNGHLDTVPIGALADWTFDPFGGEIRGGRMFGRGACDMKAGLAVQVAVAEAVRSQLMRGALVLHFAVGEERAEPGTASLLEAGFGGDFGVVTEPTSLGIATAQRGAAFIRVTIRGRGGHGGRPEIAANPIIAVPVVLAAVDEYLRDRQANEHPLLGTPTCTPTVIQAGHSPNVIPDECELILDRRLLPGESAEAEAEALRQCLGAAVSAGSHSVAVGLVGAGFQPCETRSDSPLAAAMVDAVTVVSGRRPALIGTPYSSDVRNLVLDGEMDAVTFGPGSIDDAHRPNESVVLEDVFAAADVLLRASGQLLG